jgi:hypothetical protein
MVPPNVGPPPDPIITTIATGDALVNTSVPETTYVAELQGVVLGRRAESIYEENATISQSGPIFNEDALAIAPESWTFSSTGEDAVLIPFSIFETFGGEIMLRGAKDHFINEFPPTFGEHVTPPVIIGSI